MSTDCLIAFGSNLGDSDQWFATICRDWESDQRISLLRASSLITTLPVGIGDGSEKSQASYRNACIRFSYSACQDSLFALLRETELKFGRQRRERWGARTVDLDLLLFGEQVFDTLDLQVPHPRMTFRRFVLEPAVEIAGKMVHPWSKLTLQQHLACLDLRPDAVEIVLPHEPVELASARAPLARFEQRGWQIHFSTGGDLPAPETTKLLVFTRELSLELLDQVRRFCGATLDSTAEVNEFNVGEVAAAIEAMNPLLKT